jgi:hypothetical protein
VEKKISIPETSSGAISKGIPINRCELTTLLKIYMYKEESSRGILNSKTKQHREESILIHGYNW